MEIKEVIVTLSEWQSWKEFLMALSKEELAELLLDRMVEDNSFSRKLFYKLSNEASSTGELIIKFETAVNDEMNQKVPDVDFLRMLSKKVMVRAETEENLLDKFRLYVSVIKSLDSALGYGAGYENENEDALIELMDQCRDLMLTIIEEKNADLSTLDIGQVYDYLKNEADSYHSFDGDNRIEDVLKNMGSQSS